MSIYEVFPIFFYSLCCSVIIYACFDLNKQIKSNAKMRERFNGVMVEIKDLGPGVYMLTRPIKYNLKEFLEDAKFNGEYIGYYHPLNIVAYNDSKDEIKKEIISKINILAALRHGFPETVISGSTYLTKKAYKHIDEIIIPMSKVVSSGFPAPGSTNWNEDLKRLGK